jgi:hypothetical protein
MPKINPASSASSLLGEQASADLKQIHARNTAKFNTVVLPRLKLQQETELLKQLIAKIDIYLQEKIKFEGKDIIKNYVTAVFAEIINDATLDVTLAELQVYLVNMVVCIDRLYANQKNIAVHITIIAAICLLLAIKNGSNYRLVPKFIDASGIALKETPWQALELEILKCIKWEVPNDNLDNPVYLKYCEKLFNFQPGQANVSPPVKSAAALEISPDKSILYDEIFKQFGINPDMKDDDYELIVLPPSTGQPNAAAAETAPKQPEQKSDANAAPNAMAAVAAAAQPEDGDAKMSDAAELTMADLEKVEKAHEEEKRIERASKRPKTKHSNSTLTGAMFCLPNDRPPQSSESAASSEIVNRVPLAKRKLEAGVPPPPLPRNNM